MEKLSVVVTLGCAIQLSENVLLTVHCAAAQNVRECAVDCAAQCTVNSTFSLNCIVQPSVTTTESFSLKMTQQDRNMYECVTIDEKNSLCICW
jgi:hypothetical protein